MCNYNSTLLLSLPLCLLFLYYYYFLGFLGALINVFPVSFPLYKLNTNNLLLLYTFCHVYLFSTFIFNSIETYFFHIFVSMISIFCFSPENLKIERIVVKVSIETFKRIIFLSIIRYFKG